MSFKYETNPFYNKKEPYYRVYLKNNPFKITDINEDILENFKRDTLHKKYLYTESSVLEITNKDVIKVEYIDAAVFSKNLSNDTNNIDLIIDKSYEKREEKEFHIPILHDEVAIHHITYSITAKSNLKFNIIKKDNKIIDYYFTTNEKLEHSFIKDELFTFVSLLN